METIEKCAYAVEASDYEALCLWKEWHGRVSWQQENAGRMVRVGKVGEHDVFVQLSWNVVAGRRVLFYWASSRVVDHEMVERWVRAHALTPDGLRADPMNFGNLVLVIQEANGG